ncbi:YqaJ viral recombinase family protein [Yersinia mollaretii]|uniref:YqaJ viral recombinase family protein n=1 Tax=Yersinia mollaretii TaxID=33060 RepID=UPI0011A8160C|nr:YqaJ viral recombinase family protein [Yersinia mollaretii]
MQIINVQQGTPEWHALRSRHFTASEAPVMMAASSKMRRDELLNMKATGSEREISDWVQTNLFDKGHAQEATARVIVESIIGTELFPATAIDDGYLLASFDGMTMMEDLLFEHKMWNATLAQAVKNKELPPEYYWQLEQQLLVSESEKVIFVVSDGTEDNFVWMEYLPVPGRREALLAGWQQFEQDLNSYTAPEIKDIPQGKALMRLPALLVEIEGAVKESNLTVYQNQALAFIQSINTHLVTDQDFADAEETVKFCEKAEKELDLIKQQALSKTEQIDLLFRTIDTLRDEMRNKRLDLSKLVKLRKEAIRLEILNKAKTALAEHITNINKQLTMVTLPAIPADFATAIKGKKTLTSLQSAANDELARAKIAANQLGEKYQANLALFTDIEPAYKTLFADINQIIALEHEHLALMIEQRITRQKQIEKQQQQDALQQQEESKKRQLAAAASVTETVTDGAKTTASQPLHPAGSVAFPDRLGRTVNAATVATPVDLIAQINADLVTAGIELTTETVQRLYNAVKAGRIRYFAITQ